MENWWGGEDRDRENSSVTSGKAFRSGHYPHLRAPAGGCVDQRHDRAFVLPASGGFL